MSVSGAAPPSFIFYFKFSWVVSVGKTTCATTYSIQNITLLWKMLKRQYFRFFEKHVDKIADIFFVIFRRNVCSKTKAKLNIQYVHFFHSKCNLNKMSEQKNLMVHDMISIMMTVLIYLNSYYQFFPFNYFIEVIIAMKGLNNTLVWIIIFKYMLWFLQIGQIHMFNPEI